MSTHTKTTQRARRHARIRTRVVGTIERPRLAVFRSNRAIYAQLIDDGAQMTIASADSRRMTEGTQRDRAEAVGARIAALAKEKGITSIVFDRGGFPYQGMIESLASGAREAGLIF